MLIEMLFLLSLAFVLYVYAGHPVLLYGLARLHPRRWSRGDVNLSVAVYISAFNEEKGIAKKIQEVLAQDFKGSFVIVVANDGSSDRTAEIVRSFRDGRVLLYDFKANRGKAAMQNEIIPTLAQDIVIFSDATSVWQQDTMTRILRDFHDPEVGCVAVDLLFVSERDGVIERGQGAYWRYERFLRKYGALARTNISASGATYAIRTALFVPTPPDISEDLAIPLRIAMTGRRVVFDPDIAVEERSSSTLESELRMRKRLAVRGVTALFAYGRFLSPRYGFAAYQLLVHKYLRFLCWVPMIVALVTNVLLRNVPPYNYLLIGHLAVYALALIGYLNVKQGIGLRFTSAFYYFVLLNYTSMLGFVSYARGIRRPTWIPER